MKYEPIDTSFLSKKVLRKLVRQQGNAFLPDQVAEGLANRLYTLSPDIAEEMASSISSLVETLRTWLEEEGVEPVENSLSTYDKRELMRGANLATLLTYHAFCLYCIEKQIEPAEEAIREGMAWARFLNDHRRESLLLEMLGNIYSLAFRKSEEIATYREAFKAARRPGDDPELELAILGEYVSSLIVNRCLDEAMEMIDYGIERGQSTLTHYDQGRYLPALMMDRGRILAIRNQRRDAIIALEEGLELALSIDENHSILTPIYYHLGQTYNHLGEQEKVFAIYQKAIEIAERNEDSLPVIWLYIELAGIYIRFYQPNLAEKALDIAEVLVSDSSFPQRSYIYVRRISQFKQQKRFDEAIEYSRKLEELHAGKPVSPILIASNYYIGRMYCERGDFELGEQAYRRALAIYHELDESEQRIEVWFALTEILLQSNRLEEAEEILDEALSIMNEQETKEKHLAEVYDLKGKIAEKKGDMEEALSCTRRCMELTVEHYQKEAKDSLQNARTLADCELYRKEAEIQRMQRKQAEQSLAEALAAFEDKKYAITSVESQLRETLGLLDKIQAREVMDVLKQAIDNIEEKVDRTDTSLHYLQTLDGEFFERLREQFPNLTRKQEHYCGLIRTGLSSREIASILNLSSEGIRSQRKRIRKRLGLQVSDSLESAIMEI